MLLLATSDDPARRDASDPETPEPEVSSERFTEDEPSVPSEPTSETEPDVITPEAQADPEAAPESPAPAAPAGVSEPAAGPEPRAPDPETAEPAASTPEPHGAVPPAPAVVPPEPLDRVPAAPAAESAPSSLEPPRPDQPKRPPLQRLALALLVIAAAALIGYVLSRPSGRGTDADALVRSVDAAGRLQLRLETDTPSEARRYVRDEFGWRVGVPVFEAIPLRGVAIAQTAPAVEVPVFLYADEEGRNVAAFAYSYALLDQVPDRLHLTDADYDELDDGTPFVRSADGNEVVVWRDRDDIYVAVTDLPPSALIDGLAMAR